MSKGAAHPRWRGGIYRNDKGGRVDTPNGPCIACNPMAERRVAAPSPMNQAPLPDPPGELSSSFSPSLINALLKQYHDTIKHVPNEEWGRAVRAIRLLLAKGLSLAQLETAVRHYAANFKSEDDRVRFAKAANRFFTAQTIAVWQHEATPIRRSAAPMPAYDPDDWCQHEPPCNSREWHAVKLRVEGG